MKGILRKIFLNLILLWAWAGIFNSIFYPTFFYLILASLVLTFLQVIIYPVIVLLFMPIQLLSLGILKWVPTVIMLFIFKYLASELYSINAITIPQLQIGSLQLPTFHLGLISSLLFLAIVYRVINGFINWILKN